MRLLIHSNPSQSQLLYPLSSAVTPHAENYTIKQHYVPSAKISQHITTSSQQMTAWSKIQR